MSAFVLFSVVVVSLLRLFVFAADQCKVEMCNAKEQ